MFEALFESPELLAVCKPDGLASVGGGLQGNTSLLDLLEAQLDSRLYVVHRLDKGVSGVIVFAKSAIVQKHLTDQFRERTVSKTYIALVHGIMSPAFGAIDAPLREFGSGRVSVDSRHGKSCLTEFQVTRYLARYSLVTVHPITGRRHQIRAHMYSVGHPIVGDVLYGNKTEQNTYPRLMLHSQQISFEYPIGKRITIEARPTPSFQDALSTLEQPRPRS
jgi:RluA family pseudouridine synthase